MLVSDGGTRRGPRTCSPTSGTDHPGVRVGGSEIIAAAEDANADTQAWVNYVLLGMVILFSAFALLNTLMLAVAGRVREFGLLRLVGGTRRQVAEDDADGGRPDAADRRCAGYGRGRGHRAAVRQGGVRVFRPDIPSLPAAALAGGAALLGLLGTMLPTRAALRTRPVDAIGIRE